MSRDDDKDQPPARFEGFENPTTTPVPDVVFDRFLAWLGEAELKALLYIIRRTFGFKKDRDPISFNQFLRGIVTRDGRQLDRGCGIKNRTNLSRALKSLEERGIVISEKGVDERGENATTVYRLHFKDRAEQGVVPEEYHRGTEAGPRVVPQRYPQQTVEQQTVSSKNKKEGRNKSNRRGVWGEDTATEPVDNSAARLSSLPTPVGQVLDRATARLEQRRQVPRVERAARARVKAPPSIAAYIKQWSGLDLHDDPHVASNVSQAARLFRHSGLSEEHFLAKLYEARTITLARSGGIHKLSEASAFQKNRAPYFFACLKDLLGLGSSP